MFPHWFSNFSKCTSAYQTFKFIWKWTLAKSSIVKKQFTMKRTPPCLQHFWCGWSKYSPVKCQYHLCGSHAMLGGMLGGEHQEAHKSNSLVKVRSSFVNFSFRAYNAWSFSFIQFKRVFGRGIILDQVYFLVLSCWFWLHLATFVLQPPLNDNFHNTLRKNAEKVCSVWIEKMQTIQLKLKILINVMQD